jgi:Na+/H+ antiporter NhaD/arsenite permease-like protein
MSPIGNPQNLLIAINGNLPTPFVTFLTILFLPTMLNLLLAFFVLKVFYRSDLNNRLENNNEANEMNQRQAKACRLSLGLIIAMICVKIAIVTVGLPIDFRLTYIALISAAPILIVGPRRGNTLRRVDWKTLAFFVSMFVLMQSVWNSGFFQLLIGSQQIDVTSIPMVFLVSIGLSQLISNVPLVALYLPVLAHAGAGTVEMVALAAGSTIAGNLTILGAASNVIIIQNAEDKANVTITFTEFLKVGVPLTVLNAFVYLAFFMLL